jgi:hypothetical protein
MHDTPAIKHDQAAQHRPAAAAAVNRSCKQLH